LLFQAARIQPPLGMPDMIVIAVVGMQGDFYGGIIMTQV